MSGVTPRAARPSTIRRTAVDLPMPGSDSMKTLGLLIRRARVYQEIGSKHTVAPWYRCRPIGTPIIGVVEPVPNGHRPHTCTVVPRYSVGVSTHEARPPPGPGNPRPLGSRGPALVRVPIVPFSERDHRVFGQHDAGRQAGRERR